MTVAADYSALNMGALLVQRQAYNCVLNVLQAHAAAVQEFRSVVPDGKISINLNSDWGEPYNPSSEADKVRGRSLSFVYSQKACAPDSHQPKPMAPGKTLVVNAIEHLGQNTLTRGRVPKTSEQDSTVLWACFAGSSRAHGGVLAGDLCGPNLPRGLAGVCQVAHILHSKNYT